jgi:peptide/nickel transport system substrate-binding protein
MKRQVWAAATGIVLVAGAAAACGGSGSSGSSGSGSSSGSAAYNAATGAVVNASDKKGGTLTFGNSDDFDSTDGGNTYYAYSLNFNRLYERPLTTYQTKPGAAGLQVAPDLAQGLGTPSDGMRTWTYKIRSGLKYEDGSPITAKDVKYAIARTFDRGILGNGPSYFAHMCIDAGSYKGPYKDKNINDFKCVETPDDTTVVIKFKDPFPDMNYLVAFPQTAPVPQAKDTGAQYALHPISSGPYMWQGKFQPKVGGTLVRNPNWDAASDPIRKALPDKIVYKAGMKSDEIDQELINGTLDVDIAGTGVQTAARQQILSNAKLKANSDDPVAGFHWYLPIDTQVVTDVNCRKAMIDAVDRDAMWRAYGGDIGGQLATSVMPPNINGRQPGTTFPVKAGDTGDATKAKADLQACGKPGGFSATMIFRSDRPKEQAVAQAVQQSLSKVGIHLTLKGMPSSGYTGSNAGSPDFMKKNNVAIATYGWAADWPTGYGYLEPLTDGAAIVSSGNSNVSMLNDPAINQLWKQVVTTQDESQRNAIYNQVDQKVLEQAAIMPNVYAKSLIYRSPKLTNVFFQEQWGMYDYATLGKSE